MTDRVEEARTELERARETAAAHVREQLDSIDEGLGELLGGEKTKEERPHGDRLRELAAKLEGLGRETEGETRAHIEEARTLVDAYLENHGTK